MPKLTEGRRLQQRQRILAAARLCFARQGYHTTTMAEIIRESGMSAGAVYGYFTGKHDLCLAAMDQEMSRLSEALEPVFEAPPPGGLRQAARLVLQKIAAISDGSETDFCRMAINSVAESRRDPQMQEALLLHLRPLLSRLDGLLRHYGSAAAPESFFALIMGQIVRQSLLGGPLDPGDAGLTELGF